MARRGIEQPFRARIGINTGFCNVGNFGSNDRMDYTIIGAEANLAARLQSIAQPDGIVLSYETFMLVRDLVRAHPLEPITLKGIAHPVVPYAVEGALDGVSGRHENHQRTRHRARPFHRHERDRRVLRRTRAPDLGKGRRRVEVSQPGSAVELNAHAVLGTTAS